jgi:hypothetical protein
MPSVSITTSKLTFIICLLSFVTASAQENSPYSRYGIGDLYPSQNIVNRAMGGLTAAYTDPVGQSINFSNPASYADFQRTPGVGGRVLYDLGFSIDSRTLRSKAPIKKYSSANFIPSYLSLGFPIAKGLGGAFVVRPYSRINYSIIANTRLAGIDSAQYLYEGNGGLNQAFFGLGKRWGNFSVGFNAGYMFGKKETNTRLGIFNTNTTDTGYAPFYYKSNSGTITSLNKFFYSLGAIYDVNLKRIPKTDKRPEYEYGVRLGGTAMFKQTFKGSQDIIRETFEYDGAGGTVSLDSIYKTSGTAINVEIPAVYTIGAMFRKTIVVDRATNSKYDVWTVGAELETSKWTQYRFGGISDRLNDYWQFRLGGQILPSTTSPAILGRSTYRVGVSFGRDYINADGNGLKTFSGTFGMGIPIAVRNSYSSQFTKLNFAVEIGKRGSNVNNITENYIRFSVGLSLSDVWFRKRKYD